MSDKNLVIFGPWTGEFSYEFQWWVPEIRKNRYEKFPDYQAIHIGYHGRSILYNDFVDEYISIPKKIERGLTYPSNFAQGDNVRVSIPESVDNFVNKLVDNIKLFNVYDKIVLYRPNSLYPRCYEQNPYGDYRHYNPSFESLHRMSQLLNFSDKNKKIVTVNARIRSRSGKRCKSDWNSKNWELFVEKLVVDLGVNVCVVYIKPNGSSAGTLDFFDSFVYKKYKNNIKIMNFDDSDTSVEDQMSLMKLTSCIIYGCTGASVLPYFLKTPVFIQQSKEESPRKRFEWQKKLSDNFSKVCIYDKYSAKNLYDSSVDEMYEVFKKFFDDVILDV